MITAKEIIKRVRKLAAEHPDNEYDSEDGSCSYHRGECSDGSVGCIFGQVLVPEFPDRNLDTFIGANDAGIIKVVSALGIEATDAEQCWMATVQMYQDGADFWRYSVDNADKQHPLPKEST